MGIIGEFDALFCKDKFDEADTKLQNAIVEVLSQYGIISYLVATACAKDKLPSRSKFFKNAQRELLTRYGQVVTDELLYGLE